MDLGNGTSRRNSFPIPGLFLLGLLFLLAGSVSGQKGQDPSFVRSNQGSLANLPDPVAVAGSGQTTPFILLSSSSDQGSGLCHHPSASSVAFWECSHTDPLGVVSPSTLPVANLSESPDFLLLASLPPSFFSGSLPASSLPQLSPDRPPRSLALSA